MKAKIFDKKFDSGDDVSADLDLSKALRSEQDQRQNQTAVEGELREHLEAKQSPRPEDREHVMKAYLKSTECYSGLYKKLAE